MWHVNPSNLTCTPNGMACILDTKLALLQSLQEVQHAPHQDEAGSVAAVAELHKALLHFCID